jgi:hypothetical protein
LTPSDHKTETATFRVASIIIDGRQINGDQRINFWKQKKVFWKQRKVHFGRVGSSADRASNDADVSSIPLSFRTAGFPQYDWKAGLSDETFPARQAACTIPAHAPRSSKSWKS